MPSDLAAIHVESHGDAVVATLTGELDLSNAVDIERQIDRQTGAAGTVVLNLSGLTFLDSSGCALIDRTAQRLQAHGKELRLVVQPDAIIERTLELAGLHVTVAVFPDEVAALSRPR